MDAKLFRPMLAATLPDDFQLEHVRWPALVSPKLDGIRAIIYKGQVVSRSLKPIPSGWVQDMLGRPDFEGLDGELILGEPADPLCYNKTFSAVMTHGANVPVNFHVFDKADTNPAMPFVDRLNWARDIIMRRGQGTGMVALRHTRVEDLESLVLEEEMNVFLGYEGTMVRWIDGPYKNGRSTNKEGFLLKAKRFQDSEAEIIGVQELMHNDNALTYSELGLATRSSHKDNLRAGGVLGAMEVRDIKTGVEFKIGSGLDAQLRKELWQMHLENQLLGTMVTYKYLAYGAKDKPRHPILKGLRSKIDV
jgi:DNA ligase-1